MFKHALTHDVAYHSLLVQRRKELHRLIGLALEELYAERLGEHYEILAHHFTTHRGHLSRRARRRHRTTRSQAKCAIVFRPSPWTETRRRSDDSEAREPGALERERVL